MGRAYYRFGHDIALRLSNGQAFALKDAELGAIFSHDPLRHDHLPVCFLRGTFTTGSYRGLVARGVFPPNPELQALALPVAVQLNLKPEWAMKIGRDAATLHQMGRRLEQNSFTDEVARKLLMLDEWQLGSAAAYPQKAKAFAESSQPAPLNPEQEAAIDEMLTEMAVDLWLVAEKAGESAQSPSLEKPLPLVEAVETFFVEEEWEAFRDEDGTLFNAVYDGENGSWMCYTQILPEVAQVLFYSVCPISVPTIVLPSMTDFLCRVNADLSLGNFEIDFSQNFVRFRTSIDVSDVGLAPLLFRNLVYQNLAVMEVYLPNVLEIIAGGDS